MACHHALIVGSRHTPADCSTYKLSTIDPSTTVSPDLINPFLFGSHAKVWLIFLGKLAVCRNSVARSQYGNSTLLMETCRNEIHIRRDNDQLCSDEGGNWKGLHYVSFCTNSLVWHSDWSLPHLYTREGCQYRLAWSENRNQILKCLSQALST